MKEYFIFQNLILCKFWLLSFVILQKIKSNFFRKIFPIHKEQIKLNSLSGENNWLIIKFNSFYLTWAMWGIENTLPWLSSAASVSIRFIYFNFLSQNQSWTERCKYGPQHCTWFLFHWVIQDGCWGQLCFFNWQKFQILLLRNNMCDKIVTLWVKEKSNFSQILGIWWGPNGI